MYNDGLKSVQDGGVTFHQALGWGHQGERNDHVSGVILVLTDITRAKSNCRDWILQCCIKMTSRRYPFSANSLDENVTSQSWSAKSLHMTMVPRLLPVESLDNGWLWLVSLDRSLGKDAE